MSGALSVFSAAASDAFNAVASMAFGAGGQPVVLGSFVFSGFEVPEHIAIGGHQGMTVHKLVGGQRIIDLLGPDDRDLEWSGEIIDGGPERRAQQLDQMRVDGAVLPLCWGTFYYTVVIREFHAEMRYSRARYRISCTVLPPPPPDDPQPDTNEAVSSDLSTASDAAPASVQPNVATAQKSLPTPPLDPGSVDAGRVNVESTGADLTSPRVAAATVDAETGLPIATPSAVTFSPITLDPSIPAQQPIGSNLSVAPVAGVDFPGSALFPGSSSGSGIGPLKIGP